MIKQSSLLALAVCAGISQMAFAESVTDQADSKGFIEGSSITGLLRNYYMDRDRQSGKADNRDWTQGADNLIPLTQPVGYLYRIVRNLAFDLNRRATLEICSVRAARPSAAMELFMITHS